MVSVALLPCAVPAVVRHACVILVLVATAVTSGVLLAGRYHAYRESRAMHTV